MPLTSNSLNPTISSVSRFVETIAETEVAWEVGRLDLKKQQWDKIVSSLHEIQRLQDDWDGLGAIAPTVKLIESAFDLAKILRFMDYESPSSVVAGPDGTILFNWQAGSVYLDAEITKPYHAEWMLANPGQPARHWVLERFSQEGIGWNYGIAEQQGQRLFSDRLIDMSVAASAGAIVNLCTL